MMYRECGESFSSKKAWLHLQQDIIDNVSAEVDVSLELIQDRSIQATISAPGKEVPLRVIPIIPTQGEGLIVLGLNEGEQLFFERTTVLAAVKRWASAK